MDDNTAKVLMAVIALISAIVTPIVVVIVTRMQNKKIESNKTEIVGKVNVVEKKLDENHKQQNGNLTKLLETTKQLATATEKAKHTDKGS